MSDSIRGNRVYVAGLAHETHSFSATPTTLGEFQDYEWACGEQLLTDYRGTRTSLGGIIDCAGSAGFGLIPGFYSFALPSGTVLAADYEELARRVTDGLRAHRCDGVLLILHGAMMAEGIGDVEGDLLARVRKVVGNDTQVIATLDLHANITTKMAESADCLVGYDTYPHVDAYERAVEATQLMDRLLHGDLQPVTAFAGVPLLSVPQTQDTDTGPLRDVFARVHEMESHPNVASITVAGGFCYTDAPGTGMAVTVTSNDDAELGASLAGELQQMIWEQRASFVGANTPVSEAVSQIDEQHESSGPAILVDVADNIGGGSPGDGTALLAEILAQGVSGVAIAIADPEAVDVAFQAGIGGAFEAGVGGKTDRLHGDPVPVSGRVRALTDGEFTYRGSYMTGQVRQMGRTAVIDAGGNYVVLSERKTMPFDDQQLRSVGITPEFCRAIVVKSATAWRAAYGDIAGKVINVDTPGICTVRLEKLPFSNLPRPIYPLDDDRVITLPEVSLL